MIPYPNQFDILSSDERLELRALIIKLNTWLGYCEDTRKAKARIDVAKDLANEEYFRIQEIRAKVWGPLPS